MKSHQGATLIELIIYTALLSVILLVSYQLFTEASYQRYNHLLEDRIFQSTQKAIFDLKREIKNAQRIDSPLFGESSSQLKLNSDSIIYLNSQGRLLKSVSGNNYFLTEKGIVLENLKFTNVGPSTLQNSLIISFDLIARQLGSKERKEHINITVTVRQ